jgi:hypothetical protein
VVYELARLVEKLDARLATRVDLEYQAGPALLVSQAHDRVAVLFSGKGALSDRFLV